MQYKNPDLDSSYRANDLGRTLYDAVLKYKPKKIVEFGSLYGYSTVAMAMALDEIGEGKIYVYDLFESYIYTHSAHKHTNQEVLKKKNLQYYLEAIRMDFPMWLHPSRSMITKGHLMKNIEKYGVSKYVSLKKKNFADWVKSPESFDMMHFDINNTGAKIKILYDAVKSSIDQGAVVYFEGGSHERDNLSFMTNHDLEKIEESGVPYRVANEKFPSLSVIEKV
ncbi:MAG: class I SAM-dependent methyltransferase [Candidatus Pacebacteria bacterium]|nr:class I SAM-dependent methyltransferase [Candidatus Paceibacterota bacterium]MBP9832175.1 class I SAM-dependent methyltransferase [Candidatus Paceibacterota bacterium]